jgi:hypothetical protein
LMQAVKLDPIVDLGSWRFSQINILESGLTKLRNLNLPTY